jgi:uroporphyrinogen decarboxylase
MMTSRERVLKALNHQQPDRPPMFVTLTPQVAAKLSKALNLPYEEPLDSLLSTRISHTKLLTHLGNDCVGIAACAPASKPTFTDENGIITNEWGMKFKNAGLYNEFYAFPLANAETAEDIDAYPFFQADDPTRFTSALQTIKEYGENYAVVADLETSIFETSWYLTGLEKFLMDMMLEPEYLNPLLDKVMEINLFTGKELIKAGADIIWAGDDFGSQNNMIMDPDLWRSLFKPRIKYMFEEFRKVNPNIKIAWHSCGSILPIIPDFIEIGLDVLNPLQPLATGMDPLFLKNEYGKDLSFFGAICVQDLLPNKTPSEIKSEVKRRAEILGKNGGYIIAPAHNIQDDTPVENVLALFEAVKELS